MAGVETKNCKISKFPELSETLFLVFSRCGLASDYSCSMGLPRAVWLHERPSLAVCYLFHSSNGNREF